MSGGRLVVAIHQPNFFPWLGYFNKVAYADVFVLLDNVQFPKTGGTWSNRVQLLVNGRARWVTVPVVRAFHGARTVHDIQMDGTVWRERFLNTLRSAYGRAPHFRELFPFLADLVGNATGGLAEHNAGAIRALAAALGFDSTKIIGASTLGVEGRATDLLIEIVRKMGGTAYLCGGGSADYQEDEKFAAAGLELIYQNFRHPVYQQRDVAEFVPGLSIIDALMNCGFDETRILALSSQPEPLRSGLQP